MNYIKICCHSSSLSFLRTRMNSNSLLSVNACELEIRFRFEPNQTNFIRSNLCRLYSPMPKVARSVYVAPFSFSTDNKNAKVVSDKVTPTTHIFLWHAVVIWASTNKDCSIFGFGHFYIKKKRQQHCHNMSTSLA